MAKIIKKVGLVIIIVLLVGELFLMIPFTVHYTENLLSGNSAYDSMVNAYETVETKIMKPIDEWLNKQGGEKKYWIPSFEDDLTRYEIPMENWNINWNSLNKGDP